jgi:hypothetical protein
MAQENSDDLSEIVEVIYCLNEKKEHNSKLILKDDPNFLESDSDEYSYVKRTIIY